MMYLFSVREKDVLIVVDAKILIDELINIITNEYNKKLASRITNPIG